MKENWLTSFCTPAMVSMPIVMLINTTFNAYNFCKTIGLKPLTIISTVINQTNY